MAVEMVEGLGRDVAGDGRRADRLLVGLGRVGDGHWREGYAVVWLLAAVLVLLVVAGAVALGVVLAVVI